MPGTMVVVSRSQRRLGTRLALTGLVARDVIGLISFPGPLASAAATKAEHEVEGRLLLDVVVREGAAVLKLLAGKDQALLVGRDALLVLDLLLHVLDGVRRLHIKSDGLAGQGLHKDLHAAAEAEQQVERRLLLDVVIREGAA